MKKNKIARVFHFDLHGTRDQKYEFLNQNSISTINWTELETAEPNNFFVKKDFTGSGQYEEGFKIDEFFKEYNNGIETGKDAFFYSFKKNELINKIVTAFQNKNETIRKYSITNTSSYRFLDKFEGSNYENNLIREINYRPFDTLYNYFDRSLQRRPAYNTMKNMFISNLALLVPRQVTDDFKHIFVSKHPTDCNLTSTAKKFGSAPIFPLYLYSDNNSERTPNLNPEIVQKIADGLSLKFTNEKEADSGTFAPIDILDYIYAVLHSPTYREKYKEFLKIDFPRVPYPKDKETFFKLVQLGGELRQIHLLESPTVGKYITQYPVGGDNVVNKPKFVNGKVYINDTQYFSGVPEVAWNFYIGGYQPAQKWLKDRKGRKLEFDDILHYQKIIVALTETDRIMKVIDEVEVE